MKMVDEVEFDIMDVDDESRADDDFSDVFDGDPIKAARRKTGLKANQHKALAIKALYGMMGDNTARAKTAFSGHTPEQMQEQYGQSGQTCAQILAEYEARDAEILAAIDWVKSQAN